MLATVTCILLCLSVFSLFAPTSAIAEPTSRPAPGAKHRFSITYKLSAGSEKWDPAIRKRIVDSMDAAVTLYNANGEFDKSLTANYSPGTPTADANYDGWVNFGNSISKRVALHEIAHTLGIGTYKTWGKFSKTGKWTGTHALAQLRAFDGPDAVLHCDHQHFWPYGLNYDKESSPVNDIRNVRMVAAFRQDMGIVNGTR